MLTALALQVLCTEKIVLISAFKLRRETWKSVTVGRLIGAQPGSSRGADATCSLLPGPVAGQYSLGATRGIVTASLRPGPLFPLYN